ncbi:hypothetical protein LguiB_001038 [Lonicera macranthoides]
MQPKAEVCLCYRWLLRAKAFVCDFASTNPPIWKQLPPVPSPMHVYFGVASPINGNVYAFGNSIPQENIPRKDTYTGMVFEPASRSWKSCPHRFEKFWFYGSAVDCALVHTKNEFVVFNHVDQKHMVLDLTTGSWGSSFYTPIRFRTEHSSSSVALGDVIYRVYHSKFYALDLAFKRPQFKRVYGLEKEIATIYRTAGIEYMVYLGKGKMCIVWGWSEPRDLHLEKDPYYDPIMYIACLKFWVGVCCQQNQLCAIVDRCEHYATQAHELYDCVAF